MDKDTRNERNEGFSSNQRLIGGTDIPIPIWRIKRDYNKERYLGPIISL